MKAIRYTVKETFLVSDAQERIQRLQALMEEYLRSVQKRTAQCSDWG